MRTVPSSKSLALQAQREACWREQATPGLSRSSGDPGGRALRHSFTALVSVRCKGLCADALALQIVERCPELSIVESGPDLTLSLSGSTQLAEDGSAAWSLTCHSGLL